MEPQKKTKALRNQEQMYLQQVVSNQIQNLQAESTTAKSQKTFADFPSDCYGVFTVQDKTTNKKFQVYMCKYAKCGMLFKKTCNFKDHLRKHLGLKPFTCEHCG